MMYKSQRLTANISKDEDDVQRFQQIQNMTNVTHHDTRDIWNRMDEFYQGHTINEFILVQRK